MADPHPVRSWICGNRSRGPHRTADTRAVATADTVAIEAFPTTADRAHRVLAALTLRRATVVDIRARRAAVDILLVEVEAIRPVVVIPAEAATRVVIAKPEEATTDVQNELL